MRGAGATSSAAAWSAISAGLRPLVSTPLFIRASQDGSRRDGLRGFLNVLLAPFVPARRHAGMLAGLRGMAVDRPAAVPQVESRPGAHGILLGGGERRERADVAPVGGLLVFLQAGNAILREIVGVHPLAAADPRQYVATEIQVAAAARLSQHALEHAGVEKIITHGRIGEVRLAGNGARMPRFLPEFAHAT